MEAENEPLDELAEAVLEGHSVDWASAEATAGAPDREAVRQLRILAGIAGLHRKLAQDTPISTRPGGPGDALDHWGRLEILERIGQGSFGEVYRAWDSKLDREVAVKLLHAGQAQPEGAAVLKEARLLARVRHPNVVIVYDADEFEGRVGLWMEFVHGRNLEQILGERQRFDAREVIRIGIELCRALAAVHDAGLLHRDIKAQNLMQTADGRLVLMDFGTGRDLEGASAPTVDAAGTPLYLAPEIFNGDRATVRTDIYSAGVLLFHLLTGAYPVRGATVKEVGSAHESGERLDLAARAPGASRSLVAAIGRAIEPDPSRRFESARDMLAALEKVLRKAETGKRRRYWLAAGAVSIAAIGLVVVAGAGRGKSGRDPRSRAAMAPGPVLAPEKRAVKAPEAMLTGTPSPDGRYLPYSEFRTGNLAIYEFATGASRVLTRSGDGGNENYAMESVVSADSSRIAYCWGDQLRVIDANGDNERILDKGQRTSPITPLQWSLDGRQILGTRKGAGTQTDLVLVSVADGSARVIRSLEGRASWQASWLVTLSPDGRYVAYDRAEDSNDSRSGIYLSTTDGNQEIPVVTGPTYDSHPTWTPDGSALVFASLRTGGPGLWLQRIKGGRPDGPPQLLDKDMGPFAPITLTRQGSLFYRHRVGLMDVYTVPIDPATGEVRGEPATVANSFLGSNLAPNWSPDGDTLVFASWRTLFGPGKNILVFHSMTTGLERELHTDMGAISGACWSPDGRLIALGGPGPGGPALRLLDVASGTIVSRFLARPGDYPPFTSMNWAPDASHLYLRRNPQMITRIDVNSGEEESLYKPPADSVLGGVSASPDGRWLAFGLYVRPEKTARLMVISAGGGSPRTLLDVLGGGAFGVGPWTRDGSHILFTRRDLRSTDESKQSSELWAVPFEGGQPRSLGLSRLGLRYLTVSPDGSRLAFVAGYPDQDIWVFENFLPPKASR